MSATCTNYILIYHNFIVWIILSPCAQGPILDFATDTSFAFICHSFGDFLYDVCIIPHDCDEALITRD